MDASVTVTCRSGIINVRFGSSPTKATCPLSANSGHSLRGCIPPKVLCGHNIELGRVLTDRVTDSSSYFFQLSRNASTLRGDSAEATSCLGASRRQRDDAPPALDDSCLRDGSNSIHRSQGARTCWSAQRPLVTHGVQSGDISTDSGMVWARTDRPARMLIEAATTDSFENVCYTTAVDAIPETDFTAKALIEDLPSGQDIFYRLRFQDLSSPKVTSEPVMGHFRTAPYDHRSISFVWSGDTAGQGWGIDPSRGGMRTYTSMLRNQPNFFVHCGDSIYADCTIPAQRKLPNGEIWRNIVTEDKSKVATTLNDYRGNYKYNLLDANLRAFNAEVPLFALWDNHEVMEDWWPGEVFDRSGYNVKSASLLAARACRAFHEFMPLRYVPSEPGRIYRKISYGPLLDLFCSICAVTAARTKPIRIVVTALIPTCSVRRKLPGSSANSNARQLPGR